MNLLKSTSIKNKCRNKIFGEYLRFIPQGLSTKKPLYESNIIENSIKRQRPLIHFVSDAYYLSRYIYNPENNGNFIPRGWQKISELKLDGLSSHAFIKGEIIIITTRGSITPRDFLDDINIILRKKVPSRFEQLLGLYKEVKEQYPDPNVIFTGHSLGGFLSQLAALKTGERAINFNPLGGLKIANNMSLINDNPQKTQILNVCNGNDLFSNLLPQVGENIKLYVNGPPHSLNTLNEIF
jgi:hypothetical protein